MHNERYKIVAFCAKKRLFGMIFRGFCRRRRRHSEPCEKQSGMSGGYAFSCVPQRFLHECCFAYVWRMKGLTPRSSLGSCSLSVVSEELVAICFFNKVCRLRCCTDAAFACAGRRCDASPATREELRRRRYGREGTSTCF